MEVEGEVGVDGPSFPSSYVTIHQLKQRWLQQQQIPTIDYCVSKIPNQAVPHKNHHRHRSINQLKPPEVTVHNSASKTLVVNVAVKPEVTVCDSASKTVVVNVASNHPNVGNQDHKTASRARKPSHQNPAAIPSKPEAEPVEEKKQHQGGHRSRNQKVLREPEPEPKPEPVEEKKQHHWSRNQKPKHKKEPLVQENDGVVEAVSITAPVKEQHQAERRSRNQKPKHKTTPFDPQNDGVVVEAIDVAAPVKEHQAGRWSRNKKVFRPPLDAAGDNDDAVVEAVAAFVKEINVCNVSHTRGGSGRFQEHRTWSRSNQYPKPSFWGKKSQMSQVWVKKGESAPN